MTGQQPKQTKQTKESFLPSAIWLDPGRPLPHRRPHINNAGVNAEERERET
jgi:hypothetical protein